MDDCALETWAASQTYELDFWKHAWPLRDLPIDEIRERRFADAAWLLGAFGYAAAGRRFGEFAGRVLEVGCGPIGFFELVEGIECDAIDTLMAAYAWELPYARLGRHGATHYLDRPIEACRPDYDFVVCSNVLDHTGDWRAFLGACCRALRPGGRLLLYTHCRARPADGHTQTFTPGAVVDAAIASGLDEIEQSVSRPMPAHADRELFLRARAGR